jgi:polyferredoxin/tetratricopeptide (TPR) repeat protein
VALAVVPDKGKGDRLHIRRSRSARWRAAVLVAVNGLMGAHIIYWYNFGHPGKTLSPVEPSESMYTIELGQLNAGFIFFASALLATFVFGRFFCGWGCHVVALQDWCSHIMNKLGVKPKPFRSRVLLWGPLLLALYMFCWVPLKRAAVVPLVRAMDWHPPSWLLTLPGPRPEFSNHFVVSDFWRTFPPWYVAIPFLLVCGFAVVYFLGSKGFCTYACPYGGFFAPLDKISVGRIVVSDACEGCGHCTAVCTSNVRVHQEVRDFGMVVDPGCMKCLDCVSVCPNDALSFSFAKPAVLARPRTAEARAGHIQRPQYDLTLWKDLLLFAFAIYLFKAFRGMPFIAFGGEMGVVPLLMAAGMAAIGAFLAWKLLNLLTTPNVRVQSLQLRHAGRFKPAGVAFALGAAAYLALGLWAGVVQILITVGDAHDEKVNLPAAVVFSPGYQPAPADADNARTALRWFGRAGPVSEGGLGWPYDVDKLNRRAWLFAVAGDLENSEKNLGAAIALVRKPGEAVVRDLRQIMLLRGKSGADVDAMYASVLGRAPDLHVVRLALAVDTLQSGDRAGAMRLLDEVVNADPPAEPMALAQVGDILMQIGELDGALEAMRRAASLHDGNGLLHAQLARALWFKDDREGGLGEMRRATELEPGNPMYFHALSEMLRELGRVAEADKAEATAQAIEAAMPRR